MLTVAFFLLCEKAVQKITMVGNKFAYCHIISVCSTIADRISSGPPFFSPVTTNELPLFFREYI